MIQLEQQQHEEFEGGWGGGLHQLPISSSLGLDQYNIAMFVVNNKYNLQAKCTYSNKALQ